MTLVFWRWWTFAVRSRLQYWNKPVLVIFPQNLLKHGKSCKTILADRTAARSIIGYWYDTVAVHQSLRPSVTLCIVALRVGVGRGWKLYCCLPRTVLPIHFFRHFCRRMYPLATTQRETEPPKFPRLEEPWAAWSCDHGYSRRGIFSSSVLWLYSTLYAVWSALLETTAILLVCVRENRYLIKRNNWHMRST